MAGGRDGDDVAIGRHAPGLGYQERSDIKVGGQLPAPKLRAGPHGLKSTVFFGHLLWTVLGQSTERTGIARQGRWCWQLPHAWTEFERTLTLLLSSVPRGEMSGGLFVIASERLIRGFRDPLAK